MSYISSNANRFYTALESSYGNLAAVTAINRIPAVKLAVRQRRETAARRDKTGTRTFGGLPPGGRLRTNFELQTYMASWARPAEPGYGPLFQAALGGTPQQFAGGTVSSATPDGRLQFAADHGLAVGQAVASWSEIRFVAALVDARTVQLNVPFTLPPAAGSGLPTTLTYEPATELPSISVFDYWSPTTAVQRLLCGAAIDEMEIVINGDYHEFHFAGVAQDIVDSGSFSGNELGSLQEFPQEPAAESFDYSVVPGNMGQAWLGTSPSQFFTITKAAVAVKNNLDTRSQEFGSNVPRAILPGEREVTAAFDLFSQDDIATVELYQAARQRSPITVMFQLGQESGQLMGVYLKSVIPEVPEFNDGESRLQWRFRPSRGQGVGDDEIAIAFG